MSELNQFSRIAGVYDTLAKIVFGKSIQRAQEHFLDELPQEGNILILGGGTGWILKSISRMRPNIKVWFVEASDKMLAAARERVQEKNVRIHFIHGTEDSIPQGIQFDALVANFYFDLFSPVSLRKVLDGIRKSIHQHGVWLVTDFINPRNWWQKALLWIMYRFFRLACGIEAHRLPPWRNELQRCDLRPVKTKEYYNGFMLTAVYRSVNE